VRRRPSRADGPGWATAGPEAWPARADADRVGTPGSAQIDRNVFFEIFSCAKINPEISR
jgi:hypothetical protein